jgi:hypothetical protein
MQERDEIAKSSGVAESRSASSLSASPNTEAKLRLDTLIPVLMSCALLWWVSRGMGWTTRLVVAAITLAVIICILLFERSGF